MTNHININICFEVPEDLDFEAAQIDNLISDFEELIVKTSLNLVDIDYEQYIY